MRYGKIMFCRLIFFNHQQSSWVKNTVLEEFCRLLELDFSIGAALAEEASPSFGPTFNHIAERGFVSMSPCLLMRLRGEALQGENTHKFLTY